MIWDSVKKVKELLIWWPWRHLTACRRIMLSTRCVLRKWKESQKYVLIHHISLGFSFNISLWRLGLCLKHQLMWGHCSLDRMIEIMDNGVYFFSGWIPCQTSLRLLFPFFQFLVSLDMPKCFWTMFNKNAAFPFNNMRFTSSCDFETEGWLIIWSWVVVNVQK